MQLSSVEFPIKCGHFSLHDLIAAAKSCRLTGFDEASVKDCKGQGHDLQFEEGCPVPRGPITNTCLSGIVSLCLTHCTKRHGVSKTRKCFVHASVPRNSHGT